MYISWRGKVERFVGDLSITLNRRQSTHDVAETTALFSECVLSCSGSHVACSETSGGDIDSCCCWWPGQAIASIGLCCENLF